jgi:hypothetical protein
MSLFGGPRAAAAGGGSRPNRRTVLLAAIAAALVVATFYDYTRGLDDGKRPAAARVAAAAAAANPPRANASAKPSPWREFVELRHYRDHAAQIRQRYQAIAAPYAEGIATFATLYSPGKPLKEQATQAIRSLVPPEVEIKDLLLAEAGAADNGIAWFTATLSLSSGDSQAMNSVLLALGDAGSGMVWKELSLAADAERRQVRATGQLALLMLPQAE